MNTKTLGSLTMAALLLTACSNEELPDSGATNDVLEVSVERGHFDSRAGFVDPNGDFYWSNSDRIGVTTIKYPNHFKSLDLKTGGGTANATFSVTLVTDDNIGEYAVYPYDPRHWISTDIDNVENLEFNFPTSYTYDKVDTDFYTAPQGSGNSFNPAMFGVINSNRVTLKHLGGVICIKISEMSVESGRLELTADKRITGNFTVPITTGEMAFRAGDETADSENIVTINFTGATVGSPGVFYVPVPVGTYSLNIKVYGNDQNDSNPTIDVNAGKYTINRCDLKKIELKTVSIGATASN